MRFLLRFLLLCLLPMVAWAQSSLPPCPTGSSARWHNCWGTFKFPGGELYVGEWKQGNFDGWGTQIIPIGETYVGQWKAGRPHGRGSTTYAKGGWFMGEFKDGKHDGQGTEMLNDGSRYVGAFKNDKYNGYGSFTWPNGTRYIGEFKDEKRNGQGIFYSSEGRVLQSGRWENDRLVQSFAIDTSRSSFNQAPAGGPASSQSNSGPPMAKRDRVAADTDEARRQQQQLQQQLAAAQNQSSPAPPSPVMATPRNAHALVIGNAAYSGSGRLDNPVNDAAAISQKLQSMGFTVTTC